MSYFTFDQHQIYYQESGEGAPLLLLHGNTASSNMFYGFTEAYEKSYRVILIDFLGHGKSDRLDEFPADLWFYEAQQVLAFLKHKKYSQVNIIGTSGGALVAINVALEAGSLVKKVIADSFEGEYPQKAFTDTVETDREASKQDFDARMFYAYMHGDDWERIVDQDTRAILRHQKEIGRFFHKELSQLKADIYLTGSKADEFVCTVSPDYFETVYGAMLKGIGHGEMHVFDTGKHPAMLSNPEAFYQLSTDFLAADKQPSNRGVNHE